MVTVATPGSHGPRNQRMFESAEEIHRPHGAEGRADPTRRLYSMRSHTEVFVGLRYL